MKTNEKYSQIHKFHMNFTLFFTEKMKTYMKFTRIYEIVDVFFEKIKKYF